MLKIKHVEMQKCKKKKTETNLAALSITRTS